jgi:hypothetical protein
VCGSGIELALCLAGWVESVGAYRLDRPVSWMRSWAIEEVLTMRQVVLEVGSAVNGKRPEVANPVLSDLGAKVVVVEHRDGWPVSGSIWRRRCLHGSPGRGACSPGRGSMISCAT